MKDAILNYLSGTEANCSFVIKNLMTGETVQFNEKEAMPSASLIKVPVMIAVMTQVKKGLLNLEQKIVIGEKDLVKYSVLEFFDPGTSCSIRELLKLMIVYSDNMASNILIELLGFDLINSCMEDLGVRDTRAQRKMLDMKAAEDGRENITTAHDMALILEALYRGEIIDAAYSAEMLEIMKGQSDECMMRRELPDEIPIARKSGELLNLGHDIAIVYTEHVDYLYIFFVRDAATNNEAREILARTSKMAYDFLKAKFHKQLV